MCSGEKREDEEKQSMAREGCGGRPRREKGMEQKAGGWLRTWGPWPQLNRACVYQSPNPYKEMCVRRRGSLCHVATGSAWREKIWISRVATIAQTMCSIPLFVGMPSFRYFVKCTAETLP